MDATQARNEKLIEMMEDGRDEFKRAVYGDRSFTWKNNATKDSTSDVNEIAESLKGVFHEDTLTEEDRQVIAENIVARRKANIKERAKNVDHLGDSLARVAEEVPNPTEPSSISEETAQKFFQEFGFSADVLLSEVLEESGLTKSHHDLQGFDTEAIEAILSYAEKDPRNAQFGPNVDGHTPPSDWKETSRTDPLSYWNGYTPTECPYCKRTSEIVGTSVYSIRPYDESKDAESYLTDTTDVWVCEFNCNNLSYKGITTWHVADHPPITLEEEKKQFVAWAKNVGLDVNDSGNYTRSHFPILSEASMSDVVGWLIVSRELESIRCRHQPRVALNTELSLTHKLTTVDETVMDGLKEFNVKMEPQPDGDSKLFEQLIEAGGPIVLGTPEERIKKLEAKYIASQEKMNKLITGLTQLVQSLQSDEM